jgi:putative membrane-bound dehydrogenase-like protein
VKLNGHTFTLPQGFTIEVAAGAEVVPRPIACDFDEKGRLYVTDSSGSNEKVAIQVEKKPHRIVRLEDTNGDGKFDKQTVFVKNVMFPEGCMWLNGSLYVAAPPQIWKFTDTNDDGVADKEEVWFDGKTLTGCANDLHGPYRGPDGWIYWCKGAFAEQDYTLPGGKAIKSRAAHIYRARPDGAGIEPVMTGGMDNPVDLVFSPGGDIFFTTTFFQHPRDGKRDGLVHAIYGAVYGKDHDPVYAHPWTHPTLMPPMTHMGPAAPCGLHRLESDQFGKEYANNLFACQFNLRKVSRHVLVPRGATYETKDSDFVVSDNIDFHPTDVIEDADGSLLIVDTGGWYKLCCPTSQLVKPDVTGAIYRVRKTGAHKIDDPRGLKIDWAKLDEGGLAKLLHDPRPAVRRRVADTVRASEKINSFNVAVCGLAAGGTEHGAAASTWLLGHENLPEAFWVAGALTQDAREDVRKAALHVLSLWRRESSHVAHLVASRLKDQSPAVRRLAAMTLGRMDSYEYTQPIFAALAEETTDRALDHALTYALLEMTSANDTRRGLAHQSPRVKRSVLAALEFHPKGGLTEKDVFPHLDAPDAALRDTAWWIAGRHPQWGDQLAGYFKDRLAAADKLKPEERDELADRLAKFAKSVPVQKVLGDSLAGAPTGSSRVILRAMARSGLKTLPEIWERGVADALTSKEESVRRDALTTLQNVQSPKDFSKLLKDLKWPPEKGKGNWTFGFHLQVQATAPPGSFSLGADTASGFATWLDRNEPPEVRAAAAEVIARSTATADGLRVLAPALKTAHPLDLAKLLGVFEKSKDEKVGLALVAALRDPKVRPAVRVEMVKPILDKYPQAVKAEAEKLYAELAEARKDERAKLDKLLADLKPGDVRRGQLVFNNAKTQCIACHKVGYVGGLIGPDLTRIGGIRTERDLLEAIVFPGASFVRSYEPVRVLTTDERAFNGVLKKDAPDEIIVIVAADKEELIARADVASITPSSVSLMPSGLDQQLTPQDLADLVAFLRACK